jgi:hypothetical protein
MRTATAYVDHVTSQLLPAPHPPLTLAAPDPLLDLWIPETARPKGSLKPRGYRVVRGKRQPILAEQVEGSTDFLIRAALAIQEAIRVPCEPGSDCPNPMSGCKGWKLPTWAPVAGPVAVAATFVFERPADPINVDYPLGYEGDLDKLQRNLGDALQRSRVIADDRQITDWVAQKRFVGSDHPLAPGERVPGVRVTVTRVIA